MGNFNKFDKDRGGKKFGGGHFGGGRRFGGHDDGPKQMFPATCSQCGQSCEVPFKPTGERPVFCSNCFKKQGGPSPRFAPKSFGQLRQGYAGQGGGNRGNTGGSSGPNAGATAAVSKAQFDSLNAKLDKILAMLASAQPKETPKTDAPEVKNKAVKKVKTPAKKSKGKKK